MCVSVIFRQDDTLQERRPYEGQAIGEETQWRMYPDGIDGGAGINRADDYQLHSTVGNEPVS